MSNQLSKKQEQAVSIAIDGITLEGNLIIPKRACGIVLFVHGSGSSRFSPRNQFVAQVLNQAGLATLLFDLLTKEEEKIDMVTAELRFDIPLLADRLVKVTDWVTQNSKTKHLRIGYFGSSTGAAAALIVAAQRSKVIDAVVSRGGRPDLAKESLPQVAAPTLLIVGGNDLPVIAMNKEALALLPAQKKLAIVPGASHLFEESGKLEEVATLAAQWFVQHVGAAKN